MSATEQIDRMLAIAQLQCFVLISASVREEFPKWGNDEIEAETRRRFTSIPPNFWDSFDKDLLDFLKSYARTRGVRINGLADSPREQKIPFLRPPHEYPTEPLVRPADGWPLSVGVPGSLEPSVQWKAEQIRPWVDHMMATIPEFERLREEALADASHSDRKLLERGVVASATVINFEERVSMVMRVALNGALLESFLDATLKDAATSKQREKIVAKRMSSFYDESIRFRLQIPRRFKIDWSESEKTDWYRLATELSGYWDTVKKYVKQHGLEREPKWFEMFKESKTYSDGREVFSRMPEDLLADVTKTPKGSRFKPRTLACVQAFRELFRERKQPTRLTLSKEFDGCVDQHLYGQNP